MTFKEKNCVIGVRDAQFAASISALIHLVELHKSLKI